MRRFTARVARPTGLKLVFLAVFTGLVAAGNTSYSQQLRRVPESPGYPPTVVLAADESSTTDDTNPDGNAAAALDEGILEFAAGNYEAALTHFNRAGNNDPVALRYRALCHLESGNSRSALRELVASRGESNTPSSDELNRGLELLTGGDLSGGIQSLRAHQQLHPDDAFAAQVLAAAVAEQGNQSRSQSRLDNAPLGEGPELFELSGQPREEPYFEDGYGEGMPCDSAVPPRRWNFTVLTGYQYDSNVSLSPDFIGLGANTNKQDGSWFVASFGDFRLVQADAANVGLIMSTYDNFYFEQGEFDYQDYMGGAYSNVALSDSWIAGIRYEFHETLLDYTHFAQEHRLVPNLTLREDFGHTTVYYEFDDGRFDIVPLVPAQNRDGQANAVGVTQAIYTSGGQGRLFFGYRFEDAVADGTDFDRTTHMVTGRIEQPFGKNQQWIADAEVRQFWDDYDNPNSLDFFGRPRQDQRLEVRAGLQRYFGAHVSFRLDYTFIDSNSNVANLFDVNFFEYNRHLLSTQLIYDF